MSEKSYYQRNRDVLLNIKEPVKKDSQSMQGINTETFLKKKRTNRENIGKTDTIICLKQKLKEYQTNYREAKKSQ